MLLFIDNIFRFTQAGSEVSALLGRIPCAVGYQPTLSTEMGELQERITSTNKGSITSVQAIYVPADDLTDPAPATAFAHLDATTVLSRAISEMGIYPAVDPLDSTSTILDARGRRRAALPGRPRGAAHPAALQGAPGHHRHPRHGRALGGRQADRRRARARSRTSCRSRSSSPRRSPARPGKYVEIKDTVRSFEEIVDGKCDDLPEQAFYMTGGDRRRARQGRRAGEEGVAWRCRRFLGVNLVTPKGVVAHTDTDSVQAPGELGEFELLPGHVPMLTALRPGVLTIGTKARARYAVSSGYLRIDPAGAVEILVEQAMPAADDRRRGRAGRPQGRRGRAREVGRQAGGRRLREPASTAPAGRARGSTPSRISSRLGYVFGGALVAFAGLVALIAITTSMATMRGMQRVAMPGRAAIMLPVGPSTVYCETARARRQALRTARGCAARARSTIRAARRDGAAAVARRTRSPASQAPRCST